MRGTFSNPSLLLPFSILLSLNLFLYSPKLHVLCKTDDLSIIAAILVVYYGVLLVLGVVAAVMTRHIQVCPLLLSILNGQWVITKKKLQEWRTRKEQKKKNKLIVINTNEQTPFNESEYIALSIYNFFFLGCVGVPMFYLLDEQPEVRLIILCLLVTLATTLFLCLLFCPKFFIIYHGGQEAYEFCISSIFDLLSIFSPFFYSEKTAERSTVVSTEGRATTGGKSVSQTSNFDD